MSLGSAFVGLADDATAAFTNPAGLDRLSRPEISFEFRGRRSDNEFLRGGRLSGTPTMRGLDTSPIPDYGTSLDSTGGAGFLSLVYPRKRWAVAAFRHELVRGSQHFDSQGSFFTDAVTSGNVRLLPIQAYQDVGITNYGASVGFKVNNAVSIGGGVSAATLKLEQTVYSYRVPSTDFYAASDYSASQRVIAATQKSDNYTGVGFTVGTLLRVTPKVQIGAVYRGAPTFNFDAKTDLLQPSSTVRSDIGVLLQAPNVFSTGASVRANDSVLLTFEYDFVAHSMLMDDYVTSVTSDSTKAAQFSIDDAHEFHGGLEWTLTKMKKTPSLRVGAWYDPAHSIVYTRSSANDEDDLVFSHFLPQRDSLTHFTLGVGLPWNQHLEINAGFDVASGRRLGSVFAVARF